MFKHQDIEIYWLKHAGFKIKTKDGVLYIDPFQLTGEQEKGDVLLLSHSHYDHLDEASVHSVVKPETVVFCSDDCKETIEKLTKVEAIHSIHPNEEHVFWTP